MEFIQLILDVDYTLSITWIMHQQLWGYKVEEKLYVGVREQKRLNTAGLHHNGVRPQQFPSRAQLIQHLHLL
jgi:hypothetical protein